MKLFGLVSLLFIALGVASAGTTASSLSSDCDSLKAKGSEVYDLNRNADVGSCVGYMKAVLDSLEDTPDLEVIKDFIVGDMIVSFQHYAKKHYAQPARTAIIDAMIADGFLRRRYVSQAKP